MKLRKRPLIQLPYKIKPVANQVAFKRCCKAIITLLQLATRPIHIIKLNIESHNTSTGIPALVHFCLSDHGADVSAPCVQQQGHTALLHFPILLSHDSSQGKCYLLKYSIYPARNKNTQVQLLFVFLTAEFTPNIQL